MCGRYQLYMSKEDLEKEYLAHAENIGELAPNYNVAPKQDLPVALVDRSTDRKIQTMQWGLIPGFYDDPGDGPTPINARSETVDEKPMFRSSFETRRCLVPANGFYEWKKTSGGKQPYRIRLKDREIMTFAGLYNMWTGSEGEEQWTYTILTTDANRTVQQVHNRMPVVLHPDRYDDWLNPDYGDYEELKSFCRPYPDEDMELYPVSKRVGNIRNNGPELLEEQQEGGGQQQLF